MGCDAGFDMFPRLSRGPNDCRDWQSFIDRVGERFGNDDVVEFGPNRVEFMVGEHPMLPLEGHKFLRFSSKITGSHCRNVERYIDAVTELARAVFGSRIKYWNELFDQYGVYGWKDVHDSIRSYNEVDLPESAPTINSAPDSMNELITQLFSIQLLPNKGKGLVACIDIAMGTRIVCEKPLFTTRCFSQPSLFEKEVVDQVRSLSKDAQRQFLSLHNNFPDGNPFVGIVRTNALPCGPEAVVGGLYPTICLVNHNCKPNAHNNWNEEESFETIHAIRDIRAGEEITISYERGEPFEARKKFLMAKFGFNCTCDLCSSDPMAMKDSDIRRREVGRLDDAIGGSFRVMPDPGSCLGDCRRLLNILQAEYGGFAPSEARIYYDAFQIAITHSDQARASVFASRARQARVVCEGADSPQAKKMERLMNQPAGHRNYGTSQKWKTSKKMVPKGLETNDFENWLWKQV